MTDEDNEFEVAISALLEYGFPKARIKRTLKNILKVYAGNEAWPLIKENGYEVVIERLISDDKPQQQQKSLRRVLDKEKEWHNLDPDTGNACGVSGSHVSGSSSLLVTSTLDVKSIDIKCHQENSWARNGSFPLPAWLNVDGSKKDVQQKFLDLHVLLDRIDQEASKPGHSVNISNVDTEVMPVENRQSECMQEIKRGSFLKPKIVKNLEAIHSNISKGLYSECGTGVRHTPTMNPQKFADSVHTNHFETCPQPLSLQTQKLTDALHSQHDVSPLALITTGIKHLQRNSLGNDAKRRKRGLTIVEPVTATRTVPQSTGERENNPQSNFYSTERLDVARMSACKLTRKKDGGLNPMYSRLQKCKQAGAETSVQKNQVKKTLVCLQEVSDLNAREGGVPVSDSNADEVTCRVPESPKLPPGFWEPSAENRGAISNDPVSSPDSPDRPPGCWEHTCAHPELSPDSPELPPGFWEPCGASQDPIVSGQHEYGQVLSDESPLLPPGFSEPYDADTSQESPRLPPGFCEASGKAAERAELPFSADLPPGFWESSENDKVGRLLGSRVTESLAKDLNADKPCSKDYMKCRGTPPREVFIANIPEEFEGVETKLYTLVREVLEGFKSVPISATLPRKIQVRRDHAFVEFCCEAMAGIFTDAYLANVSTLKIDGEQLLAARNMHLMKRDIQLRLAVASRLKGIVLNPRNVFYIGNVPSEWQNVERLFSHFASLLQGDTSCSLNSKMLTVYTIPDFADVYVHIQSGVLAETFFLRCLCDKEHLEEISTSLFVCRCSTFLPRASRVCLG